MLPKLLVYLFFVFCFYPGTLISQTASVKSMVVSPESAGISSTRLQRIDASIKSWIDSGWINGAGALIMRDGKVVYHRAFGFDHIANKKPLQTSTIFRIASQTKAITSVAVMMLYEEGKFMLDDAVSKYIPEFANPRILVHFNKADSSYSSKPAKREITIRDLLTHTSGIGYAQIGSPEQNAIYYKNGIVSGIGVGNIVLGDMIKKLAKLPLFHEPGEKYTYGLNTDVLGYLVEVTSGMRFDEFMRTRIFEPLKMNDTYFYLPSAKHDRLATLYTEDKSGRLQVMPDQYNINGPFNPHFPKTNGTFLSGGGGLSSTLMDYAIFLQMMLNGGNYNGVQILSKNSVRMMTMNQIGDLHMWGDDGQKFGLGFGLVTEKGSAAMPMQEGTFSWGGMFATSYWVDPKEKLIGLFYRNIYPTSHGNLADRFKVLVYQAVVH